MGTSMNTALESRKGIVTGSLADVAVASRQSLAETFVGAEVVVIVDTSASMESHDSRNGKSRYEVACEELAVLQEAAAGKVAVISFSDAVLFCPAGTPYFFQGSTDMAAALHFAKVADVAGMRFVLISDGEPNDGQAALRAARQFVNRIDTIYVGPELGPGRKFLRQLAAASGGQQVTATAAIGLAAAAQKLLAAA